MKAGDTLLEERLLQVIKQRRVEEFRELLKRIV
ncbi:hypothetical protein Igag_1655 [Ignisphaera aggregans DSM 17230]|uniref:Uncharacterized protein n=1 Tax=Ignisphaera aggregans (strain DSM 17230 / JCM 13409 / AQ1.S1) TaxID=583356 RepID=E0SRS2_IGNAA|nr:hypothetical protein Igag_1655 [Ignisphaera aggregans DSM 17230]